MQGDTNAGDLADTLALKLHSTTDAQVWAREFLRVVHDLDGDFDEGFIIGWFANAIETGRIAGFEAARDL